MRIESPQNAKQEEQLLTTLDDSLSPYFVCSLFPSAFTSALILLSLTPLTFPAPSTLYTFCISITLRLLRQILWGQRLDKYETQMRSKIIICNSDEMT